MIPPDRVARIKAVVLDVDGVLTDGSVGYLPGGEVKFFRLIAELGLSPEECLYVGDDVGDIPVYQQHNHNTGLRCWWRGSVLVVLMLVVVACCAFDLNHVQHVTLEDFRSRGCHENGKGSWELHGAKAEVRGPRVQLEGVDLLFHLEDGEKVRLTSPACSFNQATQMGESDEPIHVQSQTFVLDGVGYDVLANTHRIRIRSKVRMVIKRKVGTLKGTDPFAGVGRAKHIPPKNERVQQN